MIKACSSPSNIAALGANRGDLSTKALKAVKWPEALRMIGMAKRAVAGALQEAGTSSITRKFQTWTEKGLFWKRGAASRSQEAPLTCFLVCEGISAHGQSSYNLLLPRTAASNEELKNHAGVTAVRSGNCPRQTREDMGSALLQQNWKRPDALTARGGAVPFQACC